MKKTIILSLTILGLGIVNWIAAYLFTVNFVDISIPFGVAAVFITYIFTNKAGTLSRQLDTQIQGQTGIRMDITKRLTSTSFVFLGSIVYFSITLLLTFVTYKDYFI